MRLLRGALCTAPLLRRGLLAGRRGLRQRCGRGQSVQLRLERASKRPARGIVLDATGLHFEGEHLGDSLESGALGTLFDAMTAQRKRWKSTSPDKPFPGVVNIHLPPKVSCNVALRLLSTAGDAGFPDVKLWRDGTPYDIGMSTGTHFHLPDLMAKLWFRADGKGQARDGADRLSSGTRASRTPSSSPPQRNSANDSKGAGQADAASNHRSRRPRSSGSSLATEALSSHRMRSSSNGLPSRSLLVGGGSRDPHRSSAE